MLNKNILPKKLPYADQFSSTEECLNYMVKTINSTFRDTLPEAQAECVCEIPGVSPIILDGEIIEAPWGTAVAPETITLIIPHSLGSVPTGWILTDSYREDPNDGVFTIYRHSWTSTTITLKIITTNTGTAQGNIKFILLR